VIDAPGRPFLTFEAGRHLFAVEAAAVSHVAPPGRPLPEGTTVVDMVGLLSAGERRAERACFVLLKSPRDARPPVAITASRAREVVILDPGALLPLPSFAFGGTNPFLGVLPVGRPGGAGRAIFLLGEASSVLEAAAAA
jgi:hypothetical protein